MNGVKNTPAQRWLARLSFVLAGLAIVILLVLAGLKSLAMVAAGLGAAFESVVMSTPVTCAVSPGALRVWVPRDRPGVPAPKPRRDWVRLRHLAGISDLRRGHRIDRRERDGQEEEEEGRA